MSTDRKKKKRSVPRFERIKLIEYGCIGLVILLFVGLAILYGTKEKAQKEPAADAAPTSVPTPDDSIRSKALFDALEKGGFSVAYQPDHYDVLSPDGVPFSMQMTSDDRGIRDLSFETQLCPDPEEETETGRLLRAENQRVINEMRLLFDCVLPVFRRPVSNSDTIVKQCRKVVKDGEPYSAHFGHYSVRILSDPESSPQTVIVRLIRDP